MRTKERKQGLRIIFLCVILAVGFVPSVGSISAQGQEAKYPSKPLEILVPFAPGGIVDLTGRIFADYLSTSLKVPVVIKNQDGAAGLVGSTAFVQNAKPDGYSLLLTTGSTLITTMQLSKVPAFDPRKDLLPVGYLGEAPTVVAVAKASPFKSIDDLIQFAKSNPGKLNAGFASAGGITHLTVMAVIQDAGIECQVVPFLTSGALAMALLGGHVDWKCSSLPSTSQYITSGDMRVLVTTTRSPRLPGVPAGPEKGLPDVSVSLWFAFYVQPQTPKVVYDRLVSVVETMAKDPEIAKKLTNLGCTVGYKNPPQTAKLLEDQWDILGRIIKKANLKVN